MINNIKIGTKILIAISGAALMTLLIVSIVSYVQMLRLGNYSEDASVQLGITASEESRTALIARAEDYLQNIAAEQAEHVNVHLESVSDSISTLAAYVEILYANPDSFAGKPMLPAEDAPGGVIAEKYYFAKDVVRTRAVNEELRRLSTVGYLISALWATNSLMDNIYINTTSGIIYCYDYVPFVNGWINAVKVAEFVLSVDPDRVTWDNTYLDSNDRLCVTVYRSYRDETGQVAGLVNIDITLKTIINEILDLHIGTGGYAFLLDKQGGYIAHPRYGEADFNPRPLDTAEGAWREALERMVAGKHEVHIVHLDGEDRYVVSAPVVETGWTLGIAIPLQQLVAPADAVKAEIDSFTAETQAFIGNTLSGVLIHFSVIFVLTIILVGAFSYVLSRTITRPVKALANHVRQIGDGNFDNKLEVRGKDEIAELGTAFNKMTADITAYIRNLNQITIEKERINSELSIASEIQNDMLPRIFPTFSSHAYFSLFAKMEPAKEVGGDFYDFFYLDQEESKMAFVIADVSGKGVPAALFMVIAKTLIKQQMLHSGDPAGTLEQVNRILCEDNPRSMFVTVLICSIDLKTGQMIYANGGHNPPLLSASHQPYQFMHLEKGIPPGMMERRTYKICFLQLQPGDKIYLYTDGVNEAMNPRGEQFGNNRFLEAANRFRNLPPQQFDEAIRHEVAVFVEGAEQSDDITTVAISYTGREG
jgi:sigma-B regulation protein RsbU (phosphoserine phosphatase)